MLRVCSFELLILVTRGERLTRKIDNLVIYVQDAGFNDTYIQERILRKPRT